jgi:hypothetical protein
MAIDCSILGVFGVVLGARMSARRQSAIADTRTTRRCTFKWQLDSLPSRPTRSPFHERAAFIDWLASVERRACDVISDVSLE